jgi:hypothetical protein
MSTEYQQQEEKKKKRHGYRRDDWVIKKNATNATEAGIYIRKLERMSAIPGERCEVRFPGDDDEHLTTIHKDRIMHLEDWVSAREEQKKNLHNYWNNLEINFQRPGA